MRRAVPMLAAVMMASASAGANAAAQPQPSPLQHLLQAQAPSSPAAAAKNVFKGQRGKAQRRGAYTLAVQTAVHWRYARIDHELKAQSDKLGRIFNFRDLMLDQGRVLPPVITASGPASQIDSAKSERTVVATYRIERRARLVSTAPTWRTYLIHDYPVGDRPNPVLYPKTQKERTRWDNAIRRGWKAGIQQALNLFRTNLARLQRDYIGMARFSRLAAQGVVSVPIVAANTPRIRVQGKALAVGEREIRLTRTARWQHAHHWNPQASHGQ